MPLPKKPKDILDHAPKVLALEDSLGAQDYFKEVTGLAQHLQDVTGLARHLEDIRAVLAASQHEIQILWDAITELQAREAPPHTYTATTVNWSVLLPADTENRSWRLSQDKKSALIQIAAPYHNVPYGPNCHIQLPCDLILAVPDGMIVMMVPHTHLADRGVLCPNSLYGPGNHPVRLHFITTTSGVTLNQYDIVARLVALREA